LKRKKTLKPFSLLFLKRTYQSQRAIIAEVPKLRKRRKASLLRKTEETQKDQEAKTPLELVMVHAGRKG